MARKNKYRYYLAYGSNLNMEQMSRRCPGASVVGATVLNNHRLLFRGTPGNTHATIEIKHGYTVPVLLWQITDDDEAALDIYEGVPRYYTKEKFLIRVGEEVRTALVYVMTSGRPMGPPNDIYYDVIAEGYTAAGFDMEILETALNESCRRV
jgi:hypothetical protein